MRNLVLVASLLVCQPALSHYYATYYGGKFHGRKTASGEVFDQNALTCASNSHKFGTRLKVRNLKNGKTVICRVNDTGRFGRGVIVDLSKGAFSRIASLGQGKVPVSVQPVE